MANSFSFALSKLLVRNCSKPPTFATTEFAFVLPDMRASPVFNKLDGGSDMLLARAFDEERR